VLVDQFIHQHHHEGCEDELQDDHECVEYTHRVDVALGAHQCLGDRLDKDEQNGRQLLQGLLLLFVVFVLLVEVNYARVDQNLHHHRGGHDRGYTQLHERAPVGGQDGADVLELVCPLLKNGSALEGNLRRD